MQVEGLRGSSVRAIDAAQVVTETCGEESFPLVAGQMTVVGTVTVANDPDTIFVTLSTTNGWGMQETHVAVAASAEQLTDKNGRLVPGLFPEGGLHDPPVTTVEYAMSRDVLEGGETAFVAAFASVVRGDEEEGAWGQGTRVDETGGWASYLTFDLARCDDQVVVEVGPGGGDVPLPGGTLSIPAGALSGPVEITVTPIPGEDLPPSILPGTAFEFQPDGLTFDLPVSLSLQYDDTGLTSAQEAALAIHLLEPGDILTALPGTVDATANVVTAELSHFSSYAIPTPVGSLSLVSPDATNEGGQIVHTVEFLNATGLALPQPITVELRLSGPITGASIPPECTLTTPAPDTYVYTCTKASLPAGLWHMDFTHDVAPGSAGSVVEARASYSYTASTGETFAAGTPIADTPIEASLPRADLGIGIAPPDSGAYAGVPFDIHVGVGNGYENIVTTATFTLDVTDAPIADVSLISVTPDNGYMVTSIPGGFRVESPVGFLGLGGQNVFTVTILTPSHWDVVASATVQDPNTTDPFTDNNFDTEQFAVQ